MGGVLVPLPMLHGRPQIRVNKIVAFVEQGFALVAGQGVAEAVAEVEVGGVAAAFAEVAVGLAGDARLRFSHRLYVNAEPLYQILSSL